MKELIFKKCNKCGALVEVLKNCNCDDCNIMCCNEQMKVLEPNTVDASFEKHIPTYEINGELMKITVNHVMEESHFIEFIMVVTDNSVNKYIFKPNEVATVTVPYVKNSIIYSYCNTHELWKIEVK